ncbi:MAG: sensor histidine kinase [Myxococcota bacterium]
MKRIFVVGEVGDLGDQIEAMPDLDVERVATLDELAARAAERADFVVVMMYVADRTHDARLERLRRAIPHAPVLCLVQDGDSRSAERAIERWGADFLYESQLRQEHSEVAFEASLQRVDVLEQSTRLQIQLEQRNAELLGLNSLSNAVSTSLEKDVVLRRAMWVFAGLCIRGVVAVLEIEPPIPLEVYKGAESDGEDHSKLYNLRISGDFAVDGLPVCEDIQPHESWDELIDNDVILTYDSSPPEGYYPGIEPLSERLDSGNLTFLPIWGQGRPLGVALVGELAPSAQTVRMTDKTLRAMASHLGGALENARLFEQIKQAYESLQSTQDQLVHAEKFAAMGMLAAEIAHEINNPASFVISNLSVMLDYVATIDTYISELEALAAGAAEDRGVDEQIEQLRERHEIGFLSEDLDKLLNRSLAGMQRIHQIVQDLRFFSYDSGHEPGWIQLESLLDATINLVKHEAKYRAELVLDFEDTPQVFSDANRLSQVFLNLLVNAAQAIDEGSVDENQITVRTRRVDDSVCVSVTDTGKGMTPSEQQRIFEPFYTTKAPGEGTGLGLSISQDIVRSLGGDIGVTSRKGKGSTFRVIIPIRAETFASDEDIRDSGSFKAAHLEQAQAATKSRDEEGADS